MMSFIVISGDELKFDALFGDRQVTIISPLIIQGTGQATVANKKVCIAGDEKTVRLSASYSTPVYTQAGTGVVTIMKLDSSQEATECKSGAALIIKGTKFDALFTPLIPATTPGPLPITDSLSPSQGKGEFATKQNFAKAGT